MRRMLCSLLLAGVVGCSFHPSGLPDDGDAGVDAPAIDAAVIDAAVIDAPAIDAPPIDAPPIDAPPIDAPPIDAPPIDAPPIDAPPVDAPPIVNDIIHVRAVDEVIGTGDLTITGTLTITTSGTPSSSGALPGGVTLVVVPQDGGGSDLVLLRVRALTIMPAGVLRATGTRPLVVLADTVTTTGWIDVAATNGTPGAGGAIAGSGAGAIGIHQNTYNDTGGGGGSFGGLGADGGDAFCDTGCDPNQTYPGGARGNTYGSANLPTLEGGSGGGRSFFGGGAGCTAGNPGAGGGAVQIYAATSITISGGGITAGGGGGDGGDQCNSPYNWLAGHGGGSGGAIYLQTPTLQNAGLLVANGGGGGGGAGDGGDGHDGTSAGRGAGAGQGGGTNGNYSAAGGDGSIQANPADPGGLGPDQGNGGGGGGGLGRIHIRQRVPGALGTSSPTAATSTY